MRHLDFTEILLICKTLLCAQNEMKRCWFKPKPWLNYLIATWACLFSRFSCKVNLSASGLGTDFRHAGLLTLVSVFVNFLEQRSRFGRKKRRKPPRSRLQAPECPSKIWRFSIFWPNTGIVDFRMVILDESKQSSPRLNSKYFSLYHRESS